MEGLTFTRRMLPVHQPGRKQEHMDKDMVILSEGKEKEDYFYLPSACAIENVCYGGRTRGAEGKDSGSKYHLFADGAGQI